FAEQLDELDSWLQPDGDRHDDERLRATPWPARPAQRFLLGGSEQSAQLAAQLGSQFVFAAHINGDRQRLERSLQAYSR
ncbi:alkane 1-monooxygenase, partial [Pantoea allii]